jgi:hypothetical protein
MRIQTATITTMELQIALRNYCKFCVPHTIVIESYDKQIVVSLDEGGMVSADEFNHVVTG